jgi:hypothetical protein
MSTSLPATEHWGDPAWRRALEEQQADDLLRLRLLLSRRIAWLRHRTGQDPLAGYGMVVTDAQADAALQPAAALAETEFRSDQPELVDLERSIREVEAQLQERGSAMAAAGTPFPLEELAGRFGLDDVARDVLLLTLAPDLDPAFERLYAYAQDDATRRHPTAALAADVLLDPATRPAGCLPALHVDAPLFAMALLRWDDRDDDTGWASRPLRLEPRVSWYLQAVHAPVAVSGARLSPRASRPVPDELTQAAAEVVRALPATHADRPPLVNLVGPDAGQASALAERIAAARGLTLHELVIDETADLAALVAQLGRESRLRGTAYLLDGGASERRSVDVAERVLAPVFLTSEHPEQTDRQAVIVTVPASRPATRRDLWERALPDLVANDGPSLDAIVHHFACDPETVARVAAAARGSTRVRGGPVSTTDVWQWCRRYGRRRLSGLAETVEPRVGWDDIVLPADVRRQLAELAAQVRNRGIVYERWGFGDRLARGRGITALFAGPTGTGKTMAAEVLANELGLDLCCIDLAGVVDKYIGETEKNLRRIFDAAESSGAVLFFDEADALFGKRTDVRDSHDRYANIEVNYLLQRMERYTGLAILATNRRSVLDRAFLRRLAFVVDFPFPTTETRLRIWQRLLPAEAPLDGVDFAALARMELAGGNIRSVAINAAFLAAADGQCVTMDLLMRAAAREYAKLDKAATDAEFGPYLAAVQP